MYGTAPKEITTKDEALMECPFPTHLAENEDEEDPLLDKDEDVMAEKKSQHIDPIDDFVVNKKKPHVSEFDEDVKTREENETYNK